MKFFIYFRCSGINGLHLVENEVSKPKILKEVRDTNTSKSADALYYKIAQITIKTASRLTSTPITN